MYFLISLCLNISLSCAKHHWKSFKLDRKRCEKSDNARGASERDSGRRGIPPQRSWPRQLPFSAGKVTDASAQVYTLHCTGTNTFMHMHCQRGVLDNQLMNRKPYGIYVDSWLACCNSQRLSVRKKSAKQFCANFRALKQKYYESDFFEYVPKLSLS